MSKLTNSQTARHTPGPWSSDQETKYRTRWVTAPSGKGTKYIVADVAPDVPDDATRDANARLIAAAPDLLAAAQWAETILDGFEPQDDDAAERFHSGLAHLHAAVARAEGRQPA